MKIFFHWVHLCSMLITLPVMLTAQTEYVDSLKKLLSNSRKDTSTVKILNALSFAYVPANADSSYMYAEQAMNIAEQLHYTTGIFWSCITSGAALGISGNYPRALDFDLKALALGNRMNHPLEIAFANGSLSDCYYYLGDFKKSLKHEREAVSITEKLYPDNLFYMWIQLSRIFTANKQADSAIFYGIKAKDMIDRLHAFDQQSLLFPVLGNAYAGGQQFDSAMWYYRRGIPLSIKDNLETDLVDNYNGIAAVYNLRKQTDSALWYAKKILTAKAIRSYPTGLQKAILLISAIYELKNKPDSTLKYLKLAGIVKDSLFNREKTIAIQNLEYKENEKEQALEIVRIKYHNQLILYVVITGFIIIFCTAAILIKNNRRKVFQHMRNRIADDLHDEIGSDLSSISIMSELAMQSPASSVPVLMSIAESSSAIQENMNDIVWAIQSGNDGFDKIISRMKRFGTEILEAKNIVFQFENDDLLTKAVLTMAQKRDLYLFFKESVNNAAKHSEAKTVSVSLKKKQQFVELNIKDDGKGFEVSKNFDGNGMYTLKKRSDSLGGQFTIQSATSSGTLILLTFKIT